MLAAVTLYLGIEDFGFLKHNQTQHPCAGHDCLAVLIKLISLLTPILLWGSLAMRLLIHLGMKNHFIGKCYMVQKLIHKR
jgi:hypothetical protein